MQQRYHVTSIQVGRRLLVAWFEAIRDRTGGAESMNHRCTFGYIYIYCLLQRNVSPPISNPNIHLANISPDQPIGRLRTIVRTMTVNMEHYKSLDAADPLRWTREAYEIPQTRACGGEAGMFDLLPFLQRF
jgi:hypothetical protein